MKARNYTLIIFFILFSSVVHASSGCSMIAKFTVCNQTTLDGYSVSMNSPGGCDPYDPNSPNHQWYTSPVILSAGQCMTAYAQSMTKSDGAWSSHQTYVNIYDPNGAKVADYTIQAPSNEAIETPDANFTPGTDVDKNAIGIMVTPGGKTYDATGNASLFPPINFDLVNNNIVYITNETENGYISFPGYNYLLPPENTATSGIFSDKPSSSLPITLDINAKAVLVCTLYFNEDHNNEIDTVLSNNSQYQCKVNPSNERQIFVSDVQGDSSSK